MKKELGDGLFRLLAPSVAGLLACVVCLCATSWAWFSASVTAAATTIHSASYTVSVTVQQGENEPVPVAAGEEGKFSVDLSADKTYTIKLTPTGNANFGYCVVGFGGATYYTDQLVNGSLSFTVTAATETTLTITPTWGTCDSESTLSDGAVLGTPSNDMLMAEGRLEIETGPADESKDEGQEQPPDQPDETGQSGENKDSSGDSNDQNSGDPAEGDTPAGGEPPAGGESGTGTETGDSGNPAPASDASESATESTQETPSDQTAFRFPTDWNGLSS